MRFTPRYYLPRMSCALWANGTNRTTKLNLKSLLPNVLENEVLIFAFQTRTVPIFYLIFKPTKSSNVRIAARGYGHAHFIDSPRTIGEFFNSHSHRSDRGICRSIERLHCRPKGRSHLAGTHRDWRPHGCRNHPHRCR